MLAGRGRAVRGPGPVTAPGHPGFRAKSPLPPAPTNHRAPLARPEPDYEVVEFPSDQYVNAKLNPPPPPPRPQTGHPVEAGASCGLCGGGGARVRCTECGRRALCASCDDMYHRHPKRRHHQRQALSPTQLVSRDERPPLPPKAAPPVPPPRRHKISGDRSSASPMPPGLDQRRATLSSLGISPQQHHSVFAQSNRVMQPRAPQSLSPNPQHVKLAHPTQQAHLGSMPYLPTAIQHASSTPVQHYPGQTNTLNHPSTWNHQRTSLPASNLPPNAAWDQEAWDNTAVQSATAQGWGRPMRRGASTLELAGHVACAGCAHCAPSPWRYGSCANLDHPWLGGWQQPCCPTPHHPHGMRPHPHAHPHMSQTPQPYRRAESRAMSRTASRTGSRAASPAMSVRSRTSRRSKYRTPSPPSIPSSDADSESESEPPPLKKPTEKQQPKAEEKEDDSLGPPPPPPSTSWQCEFCTFVNEAGVRVCAVCCRTPTAVPKVVDVHEATASVARLTVAERASPAPNKKEMVAKQNGTKAKPKERTSTGCGPSPPREVQDTRRKVLVSPSRDRSSCERNEPKPITRHEVSIGSSPSRSIRQSTAVGPSPPREAVQKSPQREPIQKHSISVGPSPPREARSTPNNVSGNFSKKSTGTSPLRESNNIMVSSVSSRRNVSNTGTSPPPQTISTQTYEDPSTYERAASVSRSRSRRRFRDEARRERSHSRHSLSSDTRESERSVRTTGGGRWEWRERDSSPGGGEWSETERRRGATLTRRASHLDLHRARQPTRRTSSFYGSEAPSPEPLAANRAMSLEQLVGAGSRREAERGLELARLLSEAERLGFSAAEVHAALAQNPVAPLGWLRERWPSLCAGVRAAAVRLAPGAHVTEMEARAALARHRGAMWPAVTDCVERHRKQTDVVSVGSDGRLRGRVWGSPVGADDDAAPPLARSKHRTRAEDSSDEYEELAPAKAQDDWMYLPLERNTLYPEEAEIVNLSSVPWDELQIHNEFAPETSVAYIDEILRHANSNFNKAVEIARDTEDNNSSEEIPHQSKVQNIDDAKTEHAANGIKDKTIAIDPEMNNTRTEEIDIEPNINVTYEKITGIEPEFNNIRDEEIAESGINGSHDKDVANEIKTNTEDIAQKLKQLLIQAGIPSIDENLLLKGLINQDNKTNRTSDSNNTNNLDNEPIQSNINKSNSSKQNETNLLDLGQSENDFIDAYNALTRSSPLPNLMSNDTTVQEKNNSDLSESQSKAPNSADLFKKKGTVQNISNSQATSGNPTKHNKTSPKSTNAKNIVKAVPIRIGQNESSDDDRFINSPNKMVTSSSKRKINVITSSIPVSKRDVQTEEEDKSNNLREIVDTTQKMIQQMKDEINSDIHSLDDRNTTESETENSSNEADFSSEHESSYSDSEGRTDEVSSDEDESSEAEEEELEEKEEIVEVKEENPMPKMLRTSSEENEQFEEALDHIEEQMEDFKKSNFDVLNSIARSLQEEQIILIHSNSQEKQITPTENQINDYNGKINQDLNNNFTAVESFDEIYEEITSVSVNNDKTTNIVNSSLTGKDNEKKTLIAIIPPQVEIAEVETNTMELIQPLPKLETVIVIYRPESPLKIQITQTKPIVLNAITEKVDTDDIILDDNTEHNDNMKVIKSIELHIESSNSEGESDAIQNHLEAALNSDISDSELPELQNVSENRNVSSGHEIENYVTSNSNISKNQTNQINTQTYDEDISQKSSKDENLDIDVMALNTKSETPSVNNTKNNNFTTKTNSNATKSNIPKPVKTNIRQKTEKPAAKVIASKVPVRRGSVKQYPAPTPPKAHFGNVQSGHVKQLQTRLFNGKTPKISISATAASLAKLEPKPSTSTMSKKKPAPAPPEKVQEEKQTSPPTPASSPNEKKNSYFRETCRTEDEWTESDSEHSQERNPVTKAEEEPERVFEPPQPITVRRVSGQMIDLATVRLPEGSPERQARMLLAEGATETWEQACLAVELVSRGAEPPAALLAALECADLSAALAYLYQDCELCASRLPEHEMVSMLKCTHRCCRECARLYFTVQVSERSIADCVCPYCKEPELENLPEDEWLEYFAHLDILLKTLLDVDVHELFQRKLRDRTLARDPNFRWCVECSSGFFVHPKQKKLRCPECRSVSCATCRKPWSANHEGLTCEQYTAWLEDNDPERSVAAVQQHLRENGLECPRCHFKYSLSRGGCMHFTCTQCKYEFCYGCGKPFMMGARCGLSEYCAKLGLHAHHPRNCLFYLRDKEPHELQTLLQMNNVEFEVEAAEGSTGRCPIQLQKETPGGLVDAACGAEVPPSHAGLCKNHYLEYLSRLVRARKLDPLPLLGIDDLETLVRRASLRPPPRPYGSLEGLYKRGLAEIVKEKIPLD